MRSLDEHIELAVGLVQRADSERVGARDALDRVTASAHLAVHASPAFDNSAMDGYAVHAADLAGASPSRPVSLTIVGESRAGAGTAAAVAVGLAVRIMTGAPVPQGADAVVPQELAARDGDHVAFTAAPVAGSHIRRRGEDLHPGDTVLQAGTRLGPRHLAAAAAAGLGDVDVVVSPRVGFLVTGDELVDPGVELGEGHIHDSNGVFLATALSRLGAVPVDLGRVGDDPDAVLTAIAGADVDLVVTTGGASVGDHDPVKAALVDRGVDFTTVAMQPGKPQGVGNVDGIPVLCLPGNPVAVAVSVEIIVGAAIRRMLGQPEPSWHPALAGSAWASPAGREQIMPVVIDDGTVSGGEGGPHVWPATAGGSGSHLAGRLAAADGLARVAADVVAVAPGDTVLIRRFTA